MHRVREVAYRLTRARRLAPENIGEAARFLPNRLSEPAPVEFDAVEACRRLLASGSMIGVLVDELGESDGTGEARVIGVGAAVFVSSDFMRDERARPQPGLSERVLWSSLGERSVALDRRAIAAQNMTSGLNVVIVLHHGEPPSADLKAEFRRHLVERFLENMRGYQLAEILSETYGESDGSLQSDREFTVTGGFRVRSDYAEWYGRQPELMPHWSLVGLTRAEALHDESSLLALLFRYEPPRLALSSSQRKLLTEAMTHKTDAEIAVALGLSLSAVKKTWAAIFERVSTSLAGMEPWTAANDSRDSIHARGAQRRHRLLAYLLEHPEELRP